MNTPIAASSYDNAPSVYYPALFALTPLYFLFAHNLAELSFFEWATVSRLLIPSAVILFCSWSMLYINRRIFGTTPKAGVFTALLWAFLFGYGYFYAILVEHYDIHILYRINIPFFSKTMMIGPNKFYLITGIILLVLACCWLRSTARTFQRLTHFLNRFASVLLLLSCGQIVVYEGQRMLRGSDLEAAASMQSPVAEAAADSLPDIYYIILDAYAANSVLREEFGYDNTEFLSYLRQKGFYVADESRSNYAYTVLSLASSLNFDYLDALTNLIGTPTTDLAALISLSENNRVMRFLKQNGYTVIHFNTNVLPTTRNRYANIEVDCVSGFIHDRFLKLFLEMTVFDLILRKAFGSAKREEIACQFSTLAEFPKRPGPRFIFAHLVVPHEPFVFLADGREVEKTQQEFYTAKREYAPEGRRLYIQQLQYINRKTQALIETILSDSQRPPIILLQADHGTRVLTGPAPESKWFPILNAYYFPEGAPAELYPSISPVNTFRILLNRYFQTSYPLLPDRSYYSDIQYSPYQLIEVGKHE